MGVGDRRSTTPGAAPSSLQPGCFGHNEADGILFYRGPTGEVKAFPLVAGFSVSEHSPATEGQTLFAVGNYTPGGLLVALNGVDLADADYTALDGVSITLAAGASLGDVLSVTRYLTAPGAAVSAQEITAVADQTIFTIPGGYTTGQILVKLNGATLAAVNYAAVNGTSVTLATGAAAGDLLTLIKIG